MTTPDPVTTVVPEVKDAPAHVVDDVNEHTPEPEQPPVVEHVPGPPAPDAGLSELREQVGTIATAVSTLTDAVIAGATKDKSPESKPWTHAFGHVHHDGEDD